MSTVATAIIDIPFSLREKFGNTIPFSLIEGVYWDGMDWCNRYGEILPSKHDTALLDEALHDEDFVDARAFLS